jgi:hypothetical protein
MIKPVIFVFFWWAVTMALRQGDLIAFTVLLPTFLLLWSWAEEVSEPEAPLQALRTLRTHDCELDVTVGLDEKKSRETVEEAVAANKDAKDWGNRSIRC